MCTSAIPARTMRHGKREKDPGGHGLATSLRRLISESVFDAAVKDLDDHGESAVGLRSFAESFTVFRAGRHQGENPEDALQGDPGQLVHDEVGGGQVDQEREDVRGNVLAEEFTGPRGADKDQDGLQQINLFRFDHGAEDLRADLSGSRPAILRDLRIVHRDHAGQV